MRAALLALLLLVSLPAVAGEAKGSVVSLHASAQQMLPNDEVVVRFRIEAEGKDAMVLRRRVNRVSRAVSERLGREKGVVLATTGRRIEPVWRDDRLSHRRVRDGWRLVQTRRAASRDLREGLKMDLSPFTIERLNHMRLLAEAEAAAQPRGSEAQAYWLGTAEAVREAVERLSAAGVTDP